MKSGIEWMAAFYDQYRDRSAGAGIGFFQIGGGVAGDFPICVVPSIKYDLEQLAFLVALGRRLTQPHLRHVGVAIELPRPIDDSEYVRLFDCPIAFDRPSTEIVFRDEDLARPLLSARVELAGVLEEHAELRLGEGADGAPELTSRVRLVLRGGLRGEALEIGQIARQIRGR